VKKILLLTAVEVPFRGNLITDQFLKPILSSYSDEGRRFGYLALSPALFYTAKHHPWRALTRSLGKAGEVRDLTRKFGCRTTILPLAYPLHPRDFNLNRRKHRLFLFWAALPYLVQVLAYRPVMVVARSYPAATLALLSKKLLGIPYIFDLRGMYPEESVNAGIFEADSKDYRYWKRQEKLLVENARLNVVVSEPFKEYLGTIDPGAPTSVVPCCVDGNKTAYRPALKQPAKQKYGLGGRFVLLHLGSFGTQGDRGLAGRYLKRFQKVRPDAALAVVSGTPAFGPAIRAALLKEGLSERDFTIIHPSETELPELLAMGDAGLILERKMPNTKVCLSVKLGEYLASGMPVICTPYAEGAARLIRQYQCGLVVDPEGEGSRQAEEEFLKTYSQRQENGFRLVSEVLSLEQCAGKWRRILEPAG
jgi:glycosyltransferase involved in cell wall biosynthesis